MDLRDSLNRYYYDVTVSDLRQITKIQHQAQQKINLLTIILHMNLPPAIMKFRAIFRLANMTL